MEINFIAVAVATLAQFIVGAIWYTALFGKMWGKIHGFELLSKEAQQTAQKQMLPLLAVQFGLTIVTSLVFALLSAGLPAEWNAYGLAGFMWLGFIMPAQVSAVLFGGTEGRWVMTKILISVGASLLCMLVTALVFQNL